MKKFSFYILLFSLIFSSGCAHVISKNFRAKTDPTPTLDEVFKSPNTYKGKIVIWGGKIIQTLPHKDGTTLIEVLDWPLGWRGKPRRTVAFQGKFLVLVKEHLDPILYHRGKRITVAGEILGEIEADKIENLTETAYRYPLLLDKQTHIWKDYSEFSSPYDAPGQRAPSYSDDRGMGILRY